MRVLVTGFSPFEDVRVNASSLVAARVAGTLGEHVVVARTLPTAFGQARERITDEPCDAALALGVWRGSDWRLERRAAGRVASARPDAHGASWLDRELGPDRASTLPIEAWAAELSAELAMSVRASDDCGGYVCNASYHALLGRGVPALFVHLPRDVGERGIAASERVVRAVLGRLVGAR